MAVLNEIENVFEIAVRAGILLLNIIGVLTLLWSSLRCVVELFHKNEHARIRMAEGTALALSFKLGAEVLRTVIVRDVSELVIIGAIMVLRAALAFLIHWEIKNEKKNLAAASAGVAVMEDAAREL